MNEQQIIIEPDGQIRLVDHHEMGPELGQVTKQRASHVEPVNPILRGLFRLLRARARDDGLVAAFTRCWPCRWRVAIVAGPTFGPYRQRAAAIAAEIDWLNDNRL